MAAITSHTSAWSIRSASSGRRRSASAGSGFPPEFLTPATVVREDFTAEAKGEARRATATPALDLSYELKPGEAAVLAIRYPSGAITFHLPVESERRSVRGAPARVRFVVPVRATESASGRRGVFSTALKGFVLAVQPAVDAAASVALPKLAGAFEKSAWQKRGLAEGWHQVTRESLSAGKLQLAIPSSTDRSLLLLHGTFSDAASAYRGLAPSNFFDRVAPLYGGRVFAFNHFSVSRTPEENARMLLQELPNQKFTFDVITHSRGGLVLRNLVERSAVFGDLAKRFQLGRAILVAAPNDGTPLATPTRWQDTVGWLANMLEVFPDNPFTIGGEFVANGLVWLARHASGDLPGLHSMDSAGPLIAELQSPPGPPLDAYSALVANYFPDGAVLQRMIDVGVDQFFGSANDLVVPSEGGWRVDRAATFIPGSRIGCFGPGGNLQPACVTHVNFFAQAATADFLVNALSGKPQGLTPVDPSRPLPDRRFVRSAVTAVGAATEAVSAIAPTAVPGARRSVQVGGAEVVASDTFHVMILPRSDSDRRRSQILAQYGSARVLEDFFLSGSQGNAGQRWNQIIRQHQRIKNYVDSAKGSMPTDEELQQFGEVLFETLFPGRVRRLYDTARSLQGSRHLDLIFTSHIPWVAEKPWEFAYDPVRRTCLATEEVHFIRNVITARPAEVIDDRHGALRILVASAQPVRLGKLSIEEEEAVIRRGFEPLREAGLVEVVALPRATPASLHGYISTGQFSVVHFIGHGEYDHDAGRGYLVFQDEQGNPYKVDERSMREILCQRGIRLVFLNACETGIGGHADFNSGMAPALVAGGVPIVLANQYKVLDASATFFAQHFYWSVAQGMAVGEAAREARIAVNYSLSGDAMDWAVPVVYARDPNSRLCELREIDKRTMPSPAIRASDRRGIQEHEVWVSLWDTNYQFPNLRQTLEVINSVQSHYGFELVDLSVPIDAWYMEGKTKYLDADKFGARLAPQIAQLGTNFLCAIVDEWMMCSVDDGQEFNIYGWWPPKDKPPVLIFSTKALGLDPKGPETDRAIANAIVTGISGYLLNEDAHAKPPANCPRYRNPLRKLSVLTGRQRFCAACRKKLENRFKAEWKAMNAILRAFD